MCHNRINFDEVSNISDGSFQLTCPGTCSPEWNANINLISNTAAFLLLHVAGDRRTFYQFNLTYLFCFFPTLAFTQTCHSLGFRDCVDGAHDAFLAYQSNALLFFSMLALQNFADERSRVKLPQSMTSFTHSNGKQCLYLRVLGHLHLLLSSLSLSLSLSHTLSLSLSHTHSLSHTAL